MQPGTTCAKCQGRMNEGALVGPEELDATPVDGRRGEGREEGFRDRAARDGEGERTVDGRRRDALLELAHEASGERRGRGDYDLRSHAVSRHDG